MNDFKKIDRTVQDFYSYYNLLSDYVEFNFSISQDKHYNQYKNIIYPSLINYMYVGFEHHIKQLYILVYQHLKTTNNFIFNPTDFSLRDIPAYASEDFTIQDGKLLLNMTESVVSYTKQNMTSDTINELFKRLGIINVFAKATTLDTQKYKNIEFVSEDSIEGRLKFFIRYRNTCSHGIIDEYMGKEILTEWITFLIDCYNKILTSITPQIFANSKWNSSFCIIKIYNKNIICFDNKENIDITKNSILCYKRDDNYIFYRINNIKHLDSDINSTKNHIEIGLDISSCYDDKLPKEGNQLFIID